MLCLAVYAQQYSALDASACPQVLIVNVNFRKLLRGTPTLKATHERAISIQLARNSTYLHRSKPSGRSPKTHLLVAIAEFVRTHLDAIEPRGYVAAAPP